MTEREREIVERLVAGQRPAQIAFELRLSVYTVRAHLTHVQKAINARTQMELSYRYGRGEL